MAKKRVAVATVDTPEGHALEAAFKTELAATSNIEFVAFAPRDEFSLGGMRDIDILVVGGGDGFLLHMVRSCYGSVKAFFGINLGTVGFYMNEFDSTRLPDIAKRVTEIIAAGTYQEVAHPVLQAEVTPAGGPSFTKIALNDVTFKTHDDDCDPSARLAITIDGTELPIYSGDGIILATPGGSTAYNLGAGGSVISPKVPCVILTPVAPQYSAEFANLTKPVVLPPSAVVEVVALERAKRPIRVTVDNFTCNRIEKARITVSKDTVVRLLYTPEWNYIRTLATKLFGVKERRR